MLSCVTSAVSSCHSCLVCDAAVSLLRLPVRNACYDAGVLGRAAGKHTGGWLGIAVGRHWHCVCAPAGKQPWALHREAGMCDQEGSRHV